MYRLRTWLLRFESTGGIVYRVRCLTGLHPWVQIGRWRLEPATRVPWPLAAGPEPTAGRGHTIGMHLCGRLGCGASRFFLID